MRVLLVAACVLVMTGSLTTSAFAEDVEAVEAKPAAANGGVSQALLGDLGLTGLTPLSDQAGLRIRGRQVDPIQVSTSASISVPGGFQGQFSAIAGLVLQPNGEVRATTNVSAQSGTADGSVQTRSTGSVPQFFVFAAPQGSNIFTTSMTFSIFGPRGALR